MRDTLVAQSTKENFMGITATYTPQKTWTLASSPCDKAAPEKCPTDKPICMNSKVTKVNAASTNYQAYNVVTGGKTLVADNTFDICIASNDWTVMQLWDKADFKTWAWEQFGYELKVSQVKKELADGTKNAVKLGATIATLIATITLY